MNLSTIFPFSFMPPGWTFGGAWTAIYVLLAIYIIFAWTAAGRADRLAQSLLPRFVITCVLNITWLRLTGLEAYGLSVVVLVVLWAILWKIMDIITHAPVDQKVWQVTLPFGMYVGRISMAAGVIGVSQLFHLSLPEIVSSQCWTIGALVMAAAVTLIGRSKRKNRGQLLICLRALAGIGVALFAYV